MQLGSATTHSNFSSCRLLGATQQGKQNKKGNIKRSRSGKHRNDHSIQAKSPLKLSLAAFYKEEKDALTFRTKTQPNFNTNKDGDSNRLHATHYINLNDLFAKDNMRLNLKDLDCKPAKKAQVTSTECHLIDNMWESCTKLLSFNNPQLMPNLRVVQAQIKTMLSLIAEHNILDEAPLASSKKFNLQNCMAHSNCEKSLDHKEFQSDTDNNYEQEVTDQQMLKELSSEIKYAVQWQQSSAKASEEELQVKKIMYMLEGRKNNADHQLSTSEWANSMSSFNQNSQDESGFTVYEIEKCSQASPGSRKQTAKPTRKKEASSFRKKAIREQQSSEQIFSARLNSLSSSSSELEGQMNASICNKRKVLNDIVTMLNQKYNKNIRLD